MKPKPIARVFFWVSTAKRAFAMSQWTDFTRTLEDTIRKESVFDGGNLWQVISERPIRLASRQRSATCSKTSGGYGYRKELPPCSARSV